MFNSITERHFCFNCEKVSFHTVKYSNNKSKSKSVCPLCGHVTYWTISIYPNPKKDSNKQVDYIVKDIEEHLNNV